MENLAYGATVMRLVNQSSNPGIHPPPAARRVNGVVRPKKVASVADRWVASICMSSPKGNIEYRVGSTDYYEVRGTMKKGRVESDAPQVLTPQ